MAPFSTLQMANFLNRLISKHHVTLIINVDGVVLTLILWRNKTKSTYFQPMDIKSACTSGLRCNSSISSGITRRCSDRRDLPERFDLLLFVERVDLALLELRIDWRWMRFWLIVRWRFLLPAAFAFVSHWCFSDSSDVILCSGSTTRSLSINSLA